MMSCSSASFSQVSYRKHEHAKGAVESTGANKLRLTPLTHSRLWIPSQNPQTPCNHSAHEVANNLQRGKVQEPRGSSDEASQIQGVYACGMCIQSPSRKGKHGWYIRLIWNSGHGRSWWHKWGKAQIAVRNFTRPLEENSLLAQRLLSKPGMGAEVPQRSRHPHQFMQFLPCFSWEKWLGKHF